MQVRVSLRSIDIIILMVSIKWVLTVYYNFSLSKAGLQRYCTPAI
jgi:hypothetical protein